MPAAIELRRVGKRYTKEQEAGALLRSVLPFSRRSEEDLWALRELDLTVEPGETIGVLGHNGAGKTTLLRLLAGVTTPTRGKVTVRGRIAPLISLGVGFHPEMSGRENAVVNGMLLGLSAREAAERLDDIVEFAELGDFIDTPVKFYSAGMSMRLGFSVIMQMDPEVVLIDEVLAVGDAGFQFKCFDRLQRLQSEGATIVVVSHSMHMLRLLCRRGIVIRQGQLECDGGIEEAIAHHCAVMSQFEDPSQPRTSIDVTERKLVGGEGESHHASYDAPMALELRLRFFGEVSGASMVFQVVNAGGLPVASQVLPLGRPGATFHGGDEAALRIRFRARLGGGNYELVVRFYDVAGELLGTSEGLILFVTGRTASLGVVDLLARIEVDGQNRTDVRTSLLEAP